MLSEDLQRQVVAAALDDPKKRTRLLEDNPAVAAIFAGDPQPGLIRENRRAVLERFSIEATGARLLEIYKEATGRAVRQSIDKAALVRELNTGDLPLLLCPESYA
jgi:glycosyltransferase involved in cell wall biosynthesis